MSNYAEEAELAIDCAPTDDPQVAEWVADLRMAIEKEKDAGKALAIHLFSLRLERKRLGERTPKDDFERDLLQKEKQINESEFLINRCSQQRREYSSKTKWDPVQRNKLQKEIENLNQTVARLKGEISKMNSNRKRAMTIQRKRMEEAAKDARIRELEKDHKKQRSRETLRKERGDHVPPGISRYPTGKKPRCVECDIDPAKFYCPVRALGFCGHDCARSHWFREGK